MRTIFSADRYIRVPDGTEVSPFLNATDVTQNDVPWGALGDVSIAAGRVAPWTCSKVHVHPVVTVVFYLLAGRLTVRVQEPNAHAHEDRALEPDQATFVRPGGLVQLRNQGDKEARVLYIASPSYVFELAGGNVKYDDAQVVENTWEELGDCPDKVRRLTYDAHRRRTEALGRLAIAKRRPTGS